MFKHITQVLYLKELKKISNKIEIHITQICIRPKLLNHKNNLKTKDIVINNFKNKIQIIKTDINIPMNKKIEFKIKIKI